MLRNEKSILQSLLDFVRNNADSQFLINQYEPFSRTAMEGVKLLFGDISSVLSGKSDNQFSGITIMKRQSDSPSQKEYTIVYGLQNIRNLFLTLHAIKEIMILDGMYTEASRLDNMCSPFNPFAWTDKYKTMPVVSENDVYRCIVRRDYDNAICKDSNVYVNFEYILKYLKTLSSDYTPTQILAAFDKLYLVVVS